MRPDEKDRRVGRHNAKITFPAADAFFGRGQFVPLLRERIRSQVCHEK